MLLDEKMLSTLGKLGLTLYGAKTYYTLVALGRLTAAEIARETGIPRTKIYETLSRLEAEGWISSVQGRPIRFTALHPREVIDGRRQALNLEVDYLTTELTRMYDHEVDKELPKVWLIRGIDNITTKTVDMLSRARQSVILLGTFYTQAELDQVRRSLAAAKKRGVSIRVITNGGQQLMDARIDIAAALSPVIPDMKIGTPPSFRYIIIDDREMLNVFPRIVDGIPDTDDVVAMWVQNQTIAAHTTNMFNMLWEGLEKGQDTWNIPGTR